MRIAHPLRGDFQGHNSGAKTAAQQYKQVCGDKALKAKHSEDFWHGE